MLFRRTRSPQHRRQIHCKLHGSDKVFGFVFCVSLRSRAAIPICNKYNIILGRDWLWQQFTFNHGFSMRSHFNFTGNMELATSTSRQIHSRSVQDSTACKRTKQLWLRVPGLQYNNKVPFECFICFIIASIVLPSPSPPLPPALSIYSLHVDCAVCTAIQYPKSYIWTN